MRRREEFTVGARASVDIGVKSGTVEVRTGSAGTGRVSMDGDGTDEWDITQLGDSISVKSAGRRGWRSRSVRLLVEVPERSDVDITTVSADVTLIGEFGAVRIRTASGEVCADDVDRLDVSSAAGDVRVTGIADDVTCSTASGDVDLGTVGGRLVVSTASGDVRIARASGDAQMSGASGEVRVSRYDGANLSVKSISGDITLGLPTGIRVEPDISTLSGRTMLPAPSTAPSRGERRVVRIRLRTVSGDITIERSQSE